MTDLDRAFVGDDLNRRPLLTRIWISRARFSPVHLCRSCEVVVVEHGTALSQTEADAFAASQANLRRHAAK